MASRFNLLSDDNQMTPYSQGAAAGYYGHPRPTQLAMQAMQPEQGPLHAEHMCYTRMTFNDRGAMTEAVHTRGKATDVQNTLRLCGHTEEQVAETIVSLNGELEAQKALMVVERQAHEATKAELAALKAEHADLHRKFRIADGALMDLADKSAEIHTYLVNSGIFPAPGPNFVHPSTIALSVHAGAFQAQPPAGAAVAPPAPTASAQKRGRDEVGQASDIIQTRRGGA
jgi:hypothetical protein